MTSHCIKSVMIDLNIGDQLTSISCGHIILELIKFLTYQRLQIPYTYQWLKQILNKKKDHLTKVESFRKESFQSERHFMIASTALGNLDLILKSLLQEIGGPSMPEEICIMLGTSSLSCKEVYRLLLPSMCHKPQCHSNSIANDQKLQRHVFRSLVTSEALNQIFFNQMSPTNLYVYIKKRIGTLINNDNFILSNGCRFPRSCKTIVIDFRCKNQTDMLCCNDFQIFGDKISDNLVNLQILEEQEDEIDQFMDIESDTMKWYQSAYLMKGFKDCVVDGKSVTNSWLDCDN